MAGAQPEIGKEHQAILNAHIEERYGPLVAIEWNEAGRMTLECKAPANRNEVLLFVFDDVKAVTGRQSAFARPTSSNILSLGLL